MKQHRQLYINHRETEAEITRSIRATLKHLGIFHWKHWSGPMTYPKGIPDILGVYKGRMLAIEVKTKKGQLTEAQELFLNDIRREGGLAFVARSAEDVIEKLGLKDRFLFKI